MMSSVSHFSFTVADQVHQLVSASEADPDLGFMARTMALCSLPRSNPGNRKEYKRVNGPFTLYMYSSGQLPDSIGDDFARTGLGVGRLVQIRNAPHPAPAFPQPRIPCDFCEFISYKRRINHFPPVTLQGHRETHCF